MKIKKSILLGASALIASCSVLAACGGTVSEGTSTATTVAETTAETTKAAETTTSNVSSETTTTAAGALLTRISLATGLPVILTDYLSTHLMKTAQATMMPPAHRCPSLSPWKGTSFLSFLTAIPIPLIRCTR